MVASRSVAVLLYHHVGPLRAAACRGLTVLPEVFKRHIATLSAMGYIAITPDDWTAHVRDGADVPDRAVMLTFDDAYADLAEHALPVLERRSYPATVFVPTALMGKTIPCNPREPAANLPIMSAVEIRKWTSRGVLFGAHSRTHIDLTSVDAATADFEIRESKNDLETITGRTVTSFAYPYGKRNDAVEAMVRDTYGIAFGIEEGINDSSTPLSNLHRTMVQHGDTIVDVLLRARYGKSVLQRIRTAVRA
jgi:peptidoglycan/xylan/chitin deacetylase (PgdA/CDA1 family)